jgi:hypothetical protein
MAQSPVRNQLKPRRRAEDFTVTLNGTAVDEPSEFLDRAAALDRGAGKPGAVGGSGMAAPGSTESE